MVYFIKISRQRIVKKKRPSIVHMMGLQNTGRLSPRSKMGAKWLSKIKKGQVHQIHSKDNNLQVSVAHLSPLGSQLSFNTALKIESVVDWDAIRKKYKSITGDSESDNKDSDKQDKDDDSASNNNDDNNENPGASTPPTT